MVEPGIFILGKTDLTAFRAGGAAFTFSVFTALSRTVAFTLYATAFLCAYATLLFTAGIGGCKRHPGVK